MQTFEIHYLTPDVHAPEPHMRKNAVGVKSILLSGSVDYGFPKNLNGFWEDDENTVWIPAAAIIRAKLMVQ